MSFNYKLDYEYDENNSAYTTSSNSIVELHSAEKNINNDIFIIKSNMKCKNQVTAKSLSKPNGIVLGYNLSGHVEYKGESPIFPLQLDTNDSNMSIIKEDNSISTTPQGNFSNVGFVIKKKFIEETITDNKIKDFVLSSLEKDICQKLIFKRKMNDYIKLIIQDIFKLNFDEGLNNLYLQSKVLELLFLEFNTLGDKKLISKKTLKLDEQDIEAIKKAKEILIQNMQNPPSILELARMVAINDFKLKKGFKEIFGTSPYNLLLDYRLELAKKLLKEGELNVSEIAQSIGYKHTTNFSKAFIKKYDIVPTKIMSNRKYYY